VRWTHDSVHRDLPRPYPHLQAALARQLVWTQEFAAVGDLQAALEALLDANSISGELHAA
jgi:hypothetical protein